MLAWLSTQLLSYFIYGHVSCLLIALFTFSNQSAILWGLGPRWPITLKFELSRDFSDNASTHQVSASYV